MPDWSEGYISDINYTYGYYTELNPLRLRPAFLHAGLVPPEVRTACELGFGQGMSINLHAAAGLVQWIGTDFNPSQAGFAQELARVADAGAQLHDEAFEVFCRRDDLPDFDYIGLHGIWSWISDENRHVIVDFLRRKLRVGGVLYISYNTHPGWAAMVPMRDLLAQHVAVLGAQGTGILNCVESALAFADELLALNPAYAQANPQIGERLGKIREKDRHYLAHEYFNRHWKPMSFADMAQWLAPAKLQWACSAAFIDAISNVNLTGEQQAFLSGMDDPIFRQSVRDFCVNQQFRRDYWVKGARLVSPLEQQEQLRAQRVTLVQARTEVSLKVKTSLGEGILRDEIYNPILDELADNRPKTLGQLEQALHEAKINFAQIVQAVMLLCGSGALSPAMDEAALARSRKCTDRLNAHILMKARSNNDINFLASPITGGGVSVGRFEQLFLLARQRGHRQPQDWADFAWNILRMQGQKIIKEKKTLETPEENHAELSTQAADFAEKRLPVLKALHIA